jgi:predicted transposase YdaD
MSRFDTGGKHTIHIYARAWAEWLLEQQQLEVEAELSGEFQMIARATDVLLQVRNEQGERFLALTELQAHYDANMPRRLAAYAALAREKYLSEVFVTVIYLAQPPAHVVLADHFHSELMDQVSHQDFKVIRLWELDAQAALALNNPALLPFVPLMRGGGTEEILRTCLARVRKEPQAEELETVFAAFASLVVDVEMVQKITRWSMHIIRESPLYKLMYTDLAEARAEARAEGLAEGRAEGQAEGRAEGQAEGYGAALRLLQRVLVFRFQTPENQFDSQLRSLDLAAIKQLSDIVLEVESLAAFEQALHQLIQAQNPD